MKSLTVVLVEGEVVETGVDDGFGVVVSGNGVDVGLRVGFGVAVCTGVDVGLITGVATGFGVDSSTEGMVILFVYFDLRFAKIESISIETGLRLIVYASTGFGIANTAIKANKLKSWAVLFNTP